MDEPPPAVASDPVEPLRRALQRPARLKGLRAGVAEAEDLDAGTVLAKAARRTGRWLGLTPDEFEATTGLARDRDAAPSRDTDAWRHCVALTRLAGRLEATLGRRSVVRTWLRGRHLELRPTPVDVLVGPGGLPALHAYLDAFER